MPILIEPRIPAIRGPFIAFSLLEEGTPTMSHLL
jgi:hypothetical protein